PGFAVLFGGGQALVVGGGDARAGDVLAAALAEGGPAARRFGEQRELVEILLDHGLHCQIGVFEALRVEPDLLADAPALPGQPGVDPDLLPAFERQLEMEPANRLERHAVAAVAAIL